MTKNYTASLKGSLHLKNKKNMENYIVVRGGSAMSNSIIPKNTVYFNARPLFEIIK